MVNSRRGLYVVRKLRSKKKGELPPKISVRENDKIMTIGQESHQSPSVTYLPP